MLMALLCCSMYITLMSHCNACVHNEKTRHVCKQGFLFLMLYAFLSCMPLDDGVSIDTHCLMKLNIIWHNLNSQDLGLSWFVHFGQSIKGIHSSITCHFTADSCSMWEVHKVDRVLFLELYLWHCMYILNASGSEAEIWSWLL
jgi:hypothetical protein